MQNEPSVSNFTKSQSSFISDVEVVVLSVEVDLNNRAVVLNSVVGIDVSPWPFWEDPSVVNVEFRMSGIVGFSWALHNQIPVVQEQILNGTVLHKGVLVDQ